MSVRILFNATTEYTFPTKIKVDQKLASIHAVDDCGRKASKTFELRTGFNIRCHHPHSKHNLGFCPTSCKRFSVVGKTVAVVFQARLQPEILYLLSAETTGFLHRLPREVGGFILKHLLSPHHHFTCIKPNRVCILEKSFLCRK